MVATAASSVWRTGKGVLKQLKNRANGGRSSILIPQSGGQGKGFFNSLKIEPMVAVAASSFLSLEDRGRGSLTA